MKPLLHIFILMNLFSVLQAQSPILISTDFDGQAGQTFASNRCLYAIPGGSGANVNWDFSFITVIAPYTLQTASVAVSPYVADFSNSSFAHYHPILVSHRIFSHDVTALELDGEIDPSGPTLVLIDPEKLLEFPFTFGDQFTDSYSGTHPWSAPQYTLHRKGTITVEADAYGSVNMPYGTVNDLLRVKYEKTYTDSLDLDGSITSYERTIFKWYKKGLRVPVIEIGTSTINGTTLDPYTHYVSESLLGTEEIKIDLNKTHIFPNPFKMSTVIQTSLSPNSNSVLSVYNSYGQKVRTINFQGNELVFTREDLPLGTYFGRISSELEKTNNKIIKLIIQ